MRVTAGCQNGGMEIDRFNVVAELLRSEAARRRMVAPAFCSPPADPSMRRTIRRFDAVTAMISVRIDGRTDVEVTDDMVEGVIVASGLGGVPAAEARLDLLRSLSGNNGARSVPSGGDSGRQDPGTASPNDDRGDLAEKGRSRRPAASRAAAVQHSSGRFRTVLPAPNCAA